VREGGREGRYRRGRSPKLTASRICKSSSFSAAEGTRALLLLASEEVSKEEGEGGVEGGFCG
jgi:hypothetical protein